MIAIINQGYTRVLENGRTDRCLYNVQINNKLITTFQHYRSDGLAKCLERAAKAVKKYEKNGK